VTDFEEICGSTPKEIYGCTILAPGLEHENFAIEALNKIERGRVEDGKGLNRRRFIVQQKDLLRLTNKMASHAKWEKEAALGGVTLLDARGDKRNPIQPNKCAVRRQEPLELRYGQEGAPADVEVCGNRGNRQQALQPVPSPATADLEQYVSRRRRWADMTDEEDTL